MRKRVAKSPAPRGAKLGEEKAVREYWASHDSTETVDWSKAVWTHGGQPFKPDAEKSLADNGLVHKSVIRFRTPGLRGIGGSCS